MTFIVYLILINFFLFLPRYLAGLPQGWNPFSFLFGKNPLKYKLKNLYFSRIIDPFRLAFEYSLLLLVFHSLGLENTWTFNLLNIVAVFIFSFNAYLGIITQFLHKTPVIKSDWLFLKDSVGLYKGYLFLVTILLLGALVGLGFVFSNLHQIIFSLESNVWLNGLFFILILGVGLLNLKSFSLANYQFKTIFSPIIYILKSTRHSNQYNHLLNTPIEDIKKLNQYSHISLNEKPNIHIISMESYGSLVFKEPGIFEKANKSLESWNSKFKDSDIHACSSFSVPPLFATGTWYSYSTLLFGMTIDNGTKQSILFREMANFHHYESLFQFTKREGYTNLLLHGLIGNFESTIDFEKIKRNLNYETLIHNEDLDYQGQCLRFMQMQKCPPDQFTLNKGLEIASNKKAPYTLFYTTLNSHWNFDSPIETVKDWKALNHKDYNFKTTMDDTLSAMERYTHAIDYTINFSFDSVFNFAKENDIYVLFGDHQPTTLTDEKYGKETPMHIFSKNKAFIKEWEKFGFNEGIIPKPGDNYIKFEGFYSALMSCINKTFGKNPETEIPFMKDGIPFD